MAASAYLLYLKKVCALVHFKEYHFVEQNLCKLEAKEAEVAKMDFNPTVMETVNI